MFGNDRGTFGPPSSNDETLPSTNSLLELARAASAHGDLAQAAHLFLAAFDASASEGPVVNEAAIDGLREAWRLACALKDRALAEHVFEKLEPYSTGDEVAEHAEALQRLALDKLEEFGFSREDLQDMAEMVSEDFAGAVKSGNGPDAVFAQVLSVEKPDAKPSKGVLSWPLSSAAAGDDGSKDNAPTRNPEDFTYADLVGFDGAIARMHKRGIGLASEPKFSELLETLSQRHGIDSLPAFETILFSSAARDDANQFMSATSKEFNVAVVRMYMEETPMGFPVLCVSTTSNYKMNPVRGGFEGPGVLLLEDIDLWGSPFSNSIEEGDDMPPYAYMARGAREAVMFIRSAVVNPDVQVMATCGNHEGLDEFFLDLLEPISVFEIDLPTPDEREAVWNEVFAIYPSLRPLEGSDVVRLSANLSRSDIFYAAREAVDEAFRESIEQRSFRPVTIDNLYNKIAAYQPLDSAEYRELEDCAVESLRLDLDHVDDLLKGSE